MRGHQPKMDPERADDAHDPSGKVFEKDVWPAELEEIRARRRAVGDERALPEAGPGTGPSTRFDLTGLALSGGGIRSASFSLGVTQFLIEKGLFKRVDYLSTVSGGGYIGACLSALMRRGRDGERLLVERDGQHEPPALNHLRNGSNFLAPEGVLNRLRMPSLLLIGMLQTLLLFLPVIILLVLLTELFFEITCRFPLPIPRHFLALIGLLPIATAIFARPIFHSRRHTWEQRDRADRRAGFYLLIAIVAFLDMPLLAELDFLVDSDMGTVTRSASRWFAAHYQLGYASWLLWLTIALVLLLVFGLARYRTTVVLAIIGALGPQLLLAIYLLLCIYAINSSDVDGEVVDQYTAALSEYAATGQSARLEAAVGDILKTKEADPREYRIVLDTINKSDPASSVLKIVRRADAYEPWWHRVPWLRFLSTRHQDVLTIRPHRRREHALLIPEFSILILRAEWIVYLGGLAIWIFNYLFGNVNRMSLHPFYRDRLSRTFLIAPNASGVESADELRLSDLCEEGSTAPYHLINTALNLQGSRDPQLRQRKTVPFLLSKRFCGSDYTGYCETKRMEQLDDNLDLGTSMAVSAAAGGPMMGVKTVRSLAFILTLLNIRLAYWFPHPGRVGRTTWMDWIVRRHPGLPHLMAEACGMVSARGRFVNCSDGGHIENLGVYELLRRRCRTILCVDGGADPRFTFFDLTTLQRYAHIDLDARVEIDVAPLLPDENGVSKHHYAVGHITYHGGEQGTLHYLKLSYSGDESEYLRAYKRRVPAFPHEPTSEQFFSETKFEVYRALGYHVARQAFSDVRVSDPQPRPSLEKAGRSSEGNDP